MLFRFAVLFILTSLVELAILVYLGFIIGILYTILTVVATGILGAIMARHQGMATLSRIRISVECGTIPSNELFEGVLVLAGGLLLLTPGVITDIVGLALLVPKTRRTIANWLGRVIRRRIEMGKLHYWEAG
jgi:UPF0716 protein FxsA